MDSIEIDGGTAIVIYDPRSGKVIHVHEEIVLEGGRKSTNDELIQNALKLAQSFSQKKLGQLSTLLIGSRDLPHEGPLRVDMKQKRLITGAAKATRRSRTKTKKR